jgi:phage terminase small subunit
MAKLSAKQARFVEEYLKDLNATQAAIRAGYSPRSAKQHADAMLSRPHIQAAVTQAQAARSKRTEVDQDYVLARLVEIDQMDVLDIMDDQMRMKPVSEWPRIWRSYLSGFDLAEMFESQDGERALVGILKKIRWPDKVKNLELLGRHLGMFKDRIEHTGKNGGPIKTQSEDVDLSLLSDAALAELMAARRKEK